MNGLFINTRKSQCSIYSSGLMIHQSLQSDSWSLDYIEIDALSLNDLHQGRICAEGFKESYDFYIFNYHPHTMRNIEGVDARQLVNLTGRKYAIVLEMDPDNAFPSQFNMEQVGFDDYLVIDPTFKSADTSLHWFPRPVINQRPIQLRQAIPDVPVIGSFGYATIDKNFDFIVYRSAMEFDRAVVRINIPHAQYSPVDLFPQIKAACEQHVRPGIDLQFTRDYMSDSELIDWCAGNDLNCFMYDRQMAGLAATPDQVIAAGAPLAFFNNYTFRHLQKYIRPFPDWTFKDSILKSQDGIKLMRQDWNAQSCAERFKEIHFNKEQHGSTD